MPALRNLVNKLINDIDSSSSSVRINALYNTLNTSTFSEIYNVPKQLKLYKFKVYNLTNSYQIAIIYFSFLYTTVLIIYL